MAKGVSIPMKPPFTTNYDEEADVLYINGADNRAAYGEDHPLYGEGCILRFAEDNNELVGITLIGTNFRSKIVKPFLR